MTTGRLADARMPYSAFDRPLQNQRGDMMATCDSVTRVSRAFASRKDMIHGQWGLQVTHRDVAGHPQHIALATCSQVVVEPRVATSLPLHPDRVTASLREATGIKGDDTIGFTQLVDHLSD